MSSDIKPITVAYGDGIGPEIMESVIRILKEVEAPIRVETIEVGEKLYNRKYSSGIADDTWEAIDRTKVILKAPITTPQGGGYKSLNVTIRKKLGLYANIRPSIAYHPFVTTNHPNMDLVVVRENEEDIYAGIEYRQTQNVYSSIKLISEIGSEKIARYAFEYAVKNNRKKVTCFTKDNIMKFSDGIFHKTFDRVAKEYPNIASDHMIIDIGTAKLANNPDMFEVIVTENLYGDIISDVASEISGSVGMAGSSNIGDEYAMFEAIHGSAPDIAGKNLANPSGLLNGAIMMLVHIGAGEYANIVENAWKKTIEDGIHTGDIYDDSHSSRKVGTKEFTDAVIENLGSAPSKLSKASYSTDTKSKKSEAKKYSIKSVSREKKDLIGVDVFLDLDELYPDNIASKIKKLDLGNLALKTIATKGLKVWPSESRKEILSDHYCLRFMNKKDNSAINHDEIIQLLISLKDAKIDFIKTENLYNFGDNRGYSLAQGE